jgi:hypothetical protein
LPFREFFFENLIEDLDYNPKRGALYLGLGGVLLAGWATRRFDSRAEALPLIWALGCAALLLKGVFFLKRTSAGLTDQGISLRVDDATDAVPLIAPNKEFDLPKLMARLVQDFGSGPLLVGPLLHVSTRLDQAWELPAVYVFLGGAVIFGIGWFIRRFATG